ncbi:MAG TPA: serine hydrolase [Thermomicrobiales bacterium]|nr:serine hydrolase [Thermomicrobiales bacterium]
MRIRALLVMLLLGTMLIACMNDDDDNDGDGNEPTAASASSPTTETAASPTGTVATPSAVASPAGSPAASPEASPVTETVIPDTPVGERFAWVLETINNGATDLTPEEVEESFTPDVLAQLPADELIAAIQQVAAGGPFTFEGFWEPPTSYEAVGLLTSPTGEELLMVVTVEETEPYRMTGLNFQPVPAPIEFASWEDFDTQFAALAAESSFLAAEIVDGECVSVHALNPDTRLAIGSAFKLYILGELARKIDAGEVAWDDELEINDAWKSLPSGIMQDEPAGTPFTLQHYAELMISISDNTATDHLLRALGRENVEAIQAEMDHGEPDLNVPMLTTRELFALKLVMPQEVVDAYIAGTDDEQRTILENDVAAAALSVDDMADWTSPRAIDTIEWFASAEDLCQAMLWLHEAGARPGLEPIRDILSINPGVPVDSETWPWAGFKGGSEPGVLNGNWLLERADGRTFVISASLNDWAQNVDQDTTLRMLMGAMNLLADEG